MPGIVLPNNGRTYRTVFSPRTAWLAFFVDARRFKAETV
jgi:hypothetical protein